MQERHRNRDQYFRELAQSTEKYIIPDISSHHTITDSTRVLEIGCGDGGNLKPFVDRGCEVYGFDLNGKLVENGRKMLDAYDNSRITLFCEDVFNVKDIGLFDIIVVRDVIEHIPDKDRFFTLVKDFMKPDGIIYFAFPAWYMPFGGHQQITKNKLLSHMPFYHILPKPIYRGILKVFGESKDTIDELISIKECQITIEKFRNYVKRYNYRIAHETLYFINPHYEVKFKLKPRRLNPIIRKLPFVRNFFTTGCVYIITK